jgi:hypothetical protein
MAVMTADRRVNAPLLGCLLVAALAVAGLVAVHSLPSHTPKAARVARAVVTARPTRATASPSPRVTGGTVAAPGGGPGAAVADLSRLAPVQVYNVSGVSGGPVRIGVTTYSDSVRLTCDSGSHNSSGDLDYVVTGYGSMTATLGIPSYDAGAAGGAMTVTFNNNGAGTQAAGPVTVTPGHPQQVRVRFKEASQLVISCAAVSGSGAARSMDLALGNAVIGP